MRITSRSTCGDGSHVVAEWSEASDDDRKPRRHDARYEYVSAHLRDFATQWRQLRAYVLSGAIAYTHATLSAEHRRVEMKTARSGNARIPRYRYDIVVVFKSDGEFQGNVIAEIFSSPFVESLYVTRQWYHMSSIDAQPL